MVDRKKTPSILIEQIRGAILDGLYKPEERLMEADVAAQFHVSRSPVRETLQALESEGIARRHALCRDHGQTTFSQMPC